MAAIEQVRQPNEAGALDGELAMLFGEEPLRRARTCEVSDLQFTPDEIVQAARAIRHRSSTPAQQIAMARCLPDDVQVALCKWIIDPGMLAKVMRRVGIKL